MIAHPQPMETPSSALRNNFMNALNSPPGPQSASPMTPPHRRSSAPDVLPSPDLTTSSASDGFTFEMSDLMLPATAFESELFGIQDSGATVVSTSSSECVRSVSSSPSAQPLPPLAEGAVLPPIPRARRPRKSGGTSSAAERRHSLPSTLLLSRSPTGEAVTQPVPEFLCHLFSMLRDPSYSDLISWVVPPADEPDHMGGGIGGTGKIVVHRPEALQDHVLGKYYRHSKYASFQRQLNYFGFKKRLHGGKKGKLSPCSYIHDGLTDDAGSLFALKRRPPAKKRTSVDDADCAASVSSHEHDEVSVDSDKKTKKEKKDKPKAEAKKAKRDKDGKKAKKRKDTSDGGKDNDATASAVPLRVRAEEYGPPSSASSDPTSARAGKYSSCQVPIAPASSGPTPMQAEPVASSAVAPAVIRSEPAVTFSSSVTVQPVPSRPIAPRRSQPSHAAAAAAAAAAQPTLLELLSTSLPPSDVLFDDDAHFDSMDDDGAPAWVTDDGRYHYHDVDSSLVDLAMLY